MDEATWVDALRSVEMVVGLILTFFGVSSGIIFWAHKRMKSVATDAVEKASGTSRHIASQVTEIERDVEHIGDELQLVKNDVHSLSRRVGGVERSMETVARQSDLARLQVEVAGLAGSVTAELRILSGILHTFRESALRASDEGKSK
ncbi:hypothetical protein [Roseobacter sp. OBYS 0001]|uniref:hypothetical protein n=1 Tax=Roseobacter sp. OBYS 0001 TaxID=882651 RepID=UPI001BC4CCB9|nr:hypothetical protein [Roseobacter sp. OBYS 0001]GIT85423.1 hypothetical protein ROBYS_04390 [Roseobacter sp. OBYS 0001]